VVTIPKEEDNHLKQQETVVTIPKEEDNHLKCHLETAVKHLTVEDNLVRPVFLEIPKLTLTM
jgi:rRNA processing protein Krr1/Pno1